MTESGYQDREQSEIKHYAIRLYLEAATRILGSVYDIIKYVDCCAGPWNSQNSEYRDTSFGIAFDVLKATVASVPVHAYRDTIVMNPGTLGNDRPMTYVRDLRYSTELGFNLRSVLQTPSVGEQRFTVTDITTSEPEPRFFQPPEGYRIVDKRNAPQP